MISDTAKFYLIAFQREHFMTNRQFYGFTILISLLVAPYVAVISLFFF